MCLGRCGQYPAEEATVLVLLERVSEAQRLAARELRELQASEATQGGGKKKRGGAGGRDDGGHDGGDGADADTAVKDVMHAAKQKKRRK